MLLQWKNSFNTVFSNQTDKKLKTIINILLYTQAHNQEFFGAGEVFGNKDALKTFHVRHAKEEPRREKF